MEALTEIVGDDNRPLGLYRITHRYDHGYGDRWAKECPALPKLGPAQS